MGTYQKRHTPLDVKVLPNKIEGWFAAPVLDRYSKHPARRGSGNFRHSPILCFGLPTIRSTCFYASPHLPPICRLDLIYLMDGKFLVDLFLDSLIFELYSSAKIMHSMRWWMCRGQLQLGFRKRRNCCEINFYLQEKSLKK